MDGIVMSSKYRNYTEYKAAVDTELQKTAESFVRIGYLLKVARDTDILKESGYENVNEFAKAEYGIDKTQVSRFININDRFAKEGYSDELETEYQGFGYAKLSMMLTLPDVITEELSPEYSKEEVKAVKEEVDAEKEISEIEVWMEEEKEGQKELSTVLEKVVHQLGHDNPDLYLKLWKLLAAAGEEGRTENRVRELEETMAPQGEAIYTVRIQGTGRMMLSVKGNDEVIRLINIRSEEKEEHNIWDILDIIRHLNGETGIKDSGEESWEAVYGENFPKQEKEKVAPVQQQDQKKKTVPRKESKVMKAKTEPKKEQERAEVPGKEEGLPEKEPVTEREEAEVQNVICKEKNNEQNTESEEQEQEETESGENVENTPTEGDSDELDNGSGEETEEAKWEPGTESETVNTPADSMKADAITLTDEIFELVNVDIHFIEMEGMKKLKEAKSKAFTLAAVIGKLIETIEEEARR